MSAQKLSECEYEIWMAVFMGQVLSDKPVSFAIRDEDPHGERAEDAAMLANAAVAAYRNHCPGMEGEPDMGSDCELDTEGDDDEAGYPE